jgi:vacuolar fusion protein MON1
MSHMTATRHDGGLLFYSLFEEVGSIVLLLYRLITLYQIVHDNIHAKSGQESTLKLQYLKTDKESVMGWITQPFELYITLSPRLPKSAAVNAANAVARWVKKEESRLFLRDAPVF